MLEDRKVYPFGSLRIKFCDSKRTFVNVDRSALFSITAIKVLPTDNR